MHIKDLSGSWELMSFELEDKGGSKEQWGDEIRGLLLYSSDGRMSVGINKKVEKTENISSHDILDSILFYSGTYSIHGTEVLHHVTVASDPERIGKTMTRYATIDGNILILSSPIQSFGRSILTWRKVGL